MPQIRSAVNGLIINIPSDAAGVVARFHTQGDNELIFDRGTAAPKAVEEASMVVAEEEAAPRKRKRTKAPEEMV